MDFNLPKIGSGLLNKVVDAVKDGADKLGEGVEAIGDGIENVAEAVADAASGAGSIGDDVRIEAQVSSYGSSRSGGGARSRSSLSL